MRVKGKPNGLTKTCKHAIYPNTWPSCSWSTVNKYFTNLISLKPIIERFFIIQQYEYCYYHILSSLKLKVSLLQIQRSSLIHKFQYERKNSHILPL